jgi:hypothetical protein
MNNDYTDVIALIKLLEPVLKLKKHSVESTINTLKEGSSKLSADDDISKEEHNLELIEYFSSYLKTSKQEYDDCKKVVEELKKIEFVMQTPFGSEPTKEQLEARKLKEKREFLNFKNSKEFNDIMCEIAYDEWYEETQLAYRYDRTYLITGKQSVYDEDKDIIDEQARYDALGELFNKGEITKVQDIQYTYLIYYLTKSPDYIKYCSEKQNGMHM